MVDRLMKFMDRAFFMAPYFHGRQQSAEFRVRSLALLLISGSLNGYRPHQQNPS
jgi:hypothetical protein